MVSGELISDWLGELISWKNKDRCFGPIPCLNQKTEKKKKKYGDLDLFNVYFSSMMSYEYHFIEKTAWHSLKKIFLVVFYQKSWHSIPDGTGMCSHLGFYQMLNKRSKQLSLLHFLIGKLDQTSFPHPSTPTWFIGHVMWKSKCTKQPPVLKV